MLNLSHIKEFLELNSPNFNSNNVEIIDAIYRPETKCIEVTGSRETEIYIMGEQKKAATTAYFSISAPKFDEFVKKKNDSIWNAHKNFNSGE